MAESAPDDPVRITTASRPVAYAAPAASTVIRAMRTRWTPAVARSMRPGSITNMAISSAPSRPVMIQRITEVTSGGMKCGTAIATSIVTTIGARFSPRGSSASPSVRSSLRSPATP